MLQGLRKGSKSIFAKLLLGGLAAAFALWGVADVFRGTADTIVAEVGKEVVSDFQYDLQLKNQMRQLQSQTQANITMDQLKALGMDRQVLDQIIARAALDETSRRLGLTASREAIVQETRNTEVFKGADGAFDPNLYIRALQDSGLTEEGYIAATGKDIARALHASNGPHKASASTVTLTTCLPWRNAPRMCSTAAIGSPVDSTTTSISGCETSAFQSSVRKVLPCLRASANDVAVVLAEGVSGSVERFSDDMNAASKRLGMTDRKSTRLNSSHRT